MRGALSRKHALGLFMTKVILLAHHRHFSPQISDGHGLAIAQPKLHLRWARSFR